LEIAEQKKECRLGPPDEKTMGSNIQKKKDTTKKKTQKKKKGERKRENG